jgi:transcriptional regulator with XRE-family HTH domain
MSAGLKQREVAKTLGVGLRHYQKIESGECESRPSNWDKLETLFDTPQRELRRDDSDYSVTKPTVKGVA